MPPLPRRLLALAVPLLLAGCAHRHIAAVASPAADAPAPPRPALPPELAAIVPPPADGAGGYRTINSGIDGDRTVWHLRAALNVAAIGCRGPGDAGTVAAYNAMLTSKKTLLARENAQFQSSVRAAGGDSDAYMTRLYNYFAMPAAKPGFCAAAATLAPQAAATPPDAFPAFARQALAELEAPFRTVYARVDAYRAELAAWTARYGGQAQFAVATGGTPAAAPRLAYADLGSVIAWRPGRGPAYAAR